MLYDNGCLEIFLNMLIRRQRLSGVATSYWTNVSIVMTLSTFVKWRDLQSVKWVSFLFCWNTVLKYILESVRFFPLKKTVDFEWAASLCLKHLVCKPQAWVYSSFITFIYSKNSELTLSFWATSRSVYTRDGNGELVPVVNRFQIVWSVRVICLRTYQFLLLMPACFSDSCALQDNEVKLTLCCSCNKKEPSA